MGIFEHQLQHAAFAAAHPQQIANFEANLADTLAGLGGQRADTSRRLCRCKAFRYLHTLNVSSKCEGSRDDPRIVGIVVDNGGADK